MVLIQIHSFIDYMLFQISECGQIRKPIKLKCQGSRLRITLSDMKFAASEVKRLQLCREKGRNICMQWTK